MILISHRGNTNGKLPSAENRPDYIDEAIGFGFDVEIDVWLIDGVIFFIDPLYSHPHEVDVQMLMRLCNVHDVPLATNYSTAKCVVSYLKRNGDSKKSEFNN